MSLIADMLLIAGALGAAFYCFVLSRRLTRFNNLENGMGGAVAVLSVQVDEMTKALDEARRMSRGSAESLEQLTERAEAAAARIEIILASMHDLEDPEPRATVPRETGCAVRRRRRSRVASDAGVSE